MIEIAFITLFAMIGVFLYNIYNLFLSKPSANQDAVFDKWKTAFLVFIIALIIFFLYFGSTMNTLKAQTTITDGTDTYTVTDRDYLDTISFFPMMIAMLVLNFIFLVIQVMIDFKVLVGRGRMKKKRHFGY